MAFNAHFNSKPLDVYDDPMQTWSDGESDNGLDADLFASISLTGIKTVGGAVAHNSTPINASMQANGVDLHDLVAFQNTTSHQILPSEDLDQYIAAADSSNKSGYSKTDWSLMAVGKQLDGWFIKTTGVSEGQLAAGVQGLNAMTTIFNAMNSHNDAALWAGRFNLLASGFKFFDTADKTPYQGLTELNQALTVYNATQTAAQLHDAFATGHGPAIAVAAANAGITTLQVIAGSYADLAKELAADAAQYAAAGETASADLYGDQAKEASESADAANSALTYLSYGLSAYNAYNAIERGQFVDAGMEVVKNLGVVGAAVYVTYQLTKVLNRYADTHDEGEGTQLLHFATDGPMDLINELNKGLQQLFGWSGGNLWGEGKFVSALDGSAIATAYNSDHGGDGPVRSMEAYLLNALQTMDLTAAGFGGSVNGIKATLAAHPDAPDVPIGVVASRLPWMRFEGGGNYFVVKFVDPDTGEAQARTFSGNGTWSIAGEDNGRGVSAEDRAINGQFARSDDFGKSLVQQFIEHALKYHAIVPLWEAQTIAMQEQSQSPNAGQTTEMRARAHGEWLAQSAGAASKLINANNPTTSASQIARVIALDLDGDSTTNVQRKGSNGFAGALFDIDDDGYAEAMDWMGPNDGLLVLDRNANGHIDGGHELFADAQVNMDKRGINVLQEIDSNKDKKIDAADPVFNALKVWQDVNQDAVVQDGELQTLNQMGISEINFSAGSAPIPNLFTGYFVQNGQGHGFWAQDLKINQLG